MKKSKFVADLIRQCSRVGELRTAIKEGIMTEKDVYAEIGEVVNGTKKGREGDELIVVDLTGTGAQDAAIGQLRAPTSRACSTVRRIVGSPSLNHALAAPGWILRLAPVRDSIEFNQDDQKSSRGI